MATARSPEELKKLVAAWADDVDAVALNLRVLIASKFVQAVTSVTPQDTGQAVSNWQVQIGNEPKNFRGPHQPGRFLGAGDASNISPTRLAADKNLLVGNVERNRVSKTTIFVANNAPYILELDAGKSYQNEGNFIQEALDEAIQYSRRGVEVTAIGRA